MLLGFFGLIVIALIVNAITVAWSDHQVAKRLEAVRASGAPVAMADFPPPLDLPPEKDAKHYITQVEGDARVINEFIADYIDQKEAELGLSPSSGYSVNGYPWAVWPPMPDELTDNELRENPVEFTDPVPTLLKGAKLAEGWVKPDYDRTKGMSDSMGDHLEEYGYIRISGRVLRLHCLYCIENGMTDAAIQDILAMRLYAKWFVEAEDPILVSHLVALAAHQYAIESTKTLLSRAELSDEQLQSLQDAFREIDFQAMQDRALQGELPFGVAAFRQDMKFTTFWIGRAYWNWQLIELIDLYQGELDENARLHPMTTCVLPAMQAMRAATRTHIAEQRAILILLAIKQRENNGTIDELLDADGNVDLAKLELSDPAVRLDPGFRVDQKHLMTAKKTDSGWLVYSYGEDQTDDGGDVHEVHEGTEFRKPKDTGLSLPLIPSISPR